LFLIGFLLGLFFFDINKAGLFGIECIAAFLPFLLGIF